MWMLFHLICPKGPLIFLHFLKIEKKNCCSAGMSSIVLSSSLLIHSSISFYLQLNPSNVLFSLVITSVWYFLSIEVHTVFSHSFPEFSAHLYDHGFEPFVRGIAYLHFGQFFFEVFFFLLSLWLERISCVLILLNSLCFFLCVSYIGHLPVLKKWPDLWGSEAQRCLSILSSYCYGAAEIMEHWLAQTSCGAQQLQQQGARGKSS